jgi:hypothetical protein
MPQDNRSAVVQTVASSKPGLPPRLPWQPTGRPPRTQKGGGGVAGPTLYPTNGWKGCGIPCAPPSARAARRQELAERQARLAAGGERAGDRGGLVGLLALGVVYARLTTDEAPPDRRLVRQLLELHEQARRVLRSSARGAGLD